MKTTTIVKRTTNGIGLSIGAGFTFLLSLIALMVVLFVLSIPVSFVIHIYKTFF